MAHRRRTHWASPRADATAVHPAIPTAPPRTPTVVRPPPRRHVLAASHHLNRTRAFVGRNLHKFDRSDNRGICADNDDAVGARWLGPPRGRTRCWEKHASARCVRNAPQDNTGRTDNVAVKISRDANLLDALCRRPRWSPHRAASPWTRGVVKGRWALWLLVLGCVAVVPNSLLAGHVRPVGLRGIMMAAAVGWVRIMSVVDWAVNRFRPVPTAPLGSTAAPICAARAHGAPLQRPGSRRRWCLPSGC